MVAVEEVVEDLKGAAAAAAAAGVVVDGDGEVEAEGVLAVHRNGLGELTMSVARSVAAASDREDVINGKKFKLLMYSLA